jgi:hemerythrin-like metal-binding protein
MDKKALQHWIIQTSKTWSDIYNIVNQTGVAPIDRDHKQLAEYILQLNIVIYNTNGYYNSDNFYEINKILEQFISYTEYHFKREENFIKEFKIDGLKEQQEEHIYIINKLQDIINHYKIGRLSSIFELRLELLNNIIEHINTTDKTTFSANNMLNPILSISEWENIKKFIRTIHVPFIDKDHMHLTKLILKTAQELDKTNKNSFSAAETLMNELLDFAKQHFQREEELMIKYSNSEYNKHKILHTEFLEKIENATTIVKKKKNLDSKKFKETLLKWWINHINIEDYSTFTENPWLEQFYNSAENVEEIYWMISPTGIEIIDEDHKHFLGLIFELNKYLENNRVNNNLLEIKEDLNRLKEYAARHFSHEEKLMAGKDPNLVIQHIKEHIYILEKLESWNITDNNDAIFISTNLKNTLLDWWISHTNGTDYLTFGAEYEEKE